MSRRRMNIGYARVSTADQSVALQMDALTQAGCTTIHEEVSVGRVSIVLSCARYSPRYARATSW